MEYDFGGSAKDEFLQYSAKMGSGEVRASELETLGVQLKEVHFDVALRHLHLDTMQKLMADLRAANAKAYTPGLVDPTSTLAQPLQKHGIELLKHDPELVFERIGFVTPQGAAWLKGWARLEGVTDADVATGATQFDGKAGRGLHHRDSAGAGGQDSRRREDGGLADRAGLPQERRRQADQPHRIQEGRAAGEWHVATVAEWRAAAGDGACCATGSAASRITEVGGQSAVGQRQCDELSGFARSADGYQDVLLAADRVAHRDAGLPQAQVHLPQDVAGLLVMRAEHGAAFAGHEHARAFAGEQQ